MPIFRQSPVVIRYGVATAITLAVYSDAGAVVASPSGTISIYDDYGTVKVSSTACTAGTGTLTYTLAADLATESALNWQAEWNITISSVVYQYTALFDYSKRQLTIPIITSDIESRDARVKGKYSAGETTFQRQINQAWDLVLADVRGIHGIRYVEATIDSRQLKELMLQKSLELIYHEMISGDPAVSTYARAENDAKALYRHELGKPLIVDIDDDNQADGELKASYNIEVGR